MFIEYDSITTRDFDGRDFIITDVVPTEIRVIVNKGLALPSEASVLIECYSGVDSKRCNGIITYGVIAQIRVIMFESLGDTSIVRMLIDCGHKRPAYPNRSRLVIIFVNEITIITGESPAPSAKVLVLTESSSLAGWRS
jgi:hypothetical protein